MKKTFKILSLCLSIIFILSSCTMENNQDNNALKPSKVPLSINKYWIRHKSYSYVKENIGLITKNDYVVSLSQDKIIVDNLEIDKPEFKAIKAKSYDFFLSLYKTLPQDLGIENKYVTVYTANEEQGKSYKFIKVDDETLLVDTGSTLDFLKPISEEVFKGNINKLHEGTKKDYTANGVLIGLKYDRGKNPDGSYKSIQYETLFLYMDQNKNLRAYRTKDIIIPKKDMRRLSVSSYADGKALVETIKIDDPRNNVTDIKQVLPTANESRVEEISFVNPEYISIIREDQRDSNNFVGSKYRTYNIEKLDTQSPVKISDIFGEDGKNAMDSAAKNNIKDLAINGVNLVDNIDPASFIVKRKEGRWLYEGKVDATPSISEDRLRFNINIAGNRQIFKYDNLSPKFDTFKLLDEKIEDAIASPGNFFAVAKTKNTIYVYSKTDDNKIDPTPIKTINLNNNCSIIMHEWASNGALAQQWQKYISEIGKELK